MDIEQDFHSNVRILPFNVILGPFPLPLFAVPGRVMQGVQDGIVLVHNVTRRRVEIISTRPQPRISGEFLRLQELDSKGIMWDIGFNMALPKMEGGRVRRR